MKYIRLLFMSMLLASFAQAEKPNILVILLDDLGYNDTGFMGSKDILTPNIDRLAASGMRFSDAHLAGTTCSPSRAAIMTGRYQQRFGHHNNCPPHGNGMDTAETTVGQAFKAGGYRTCYVGKWHLGNLEKHHPNSRGFDDFYGLREGSRSYFPHPADDKPGGIKSIEHNGRHVKWEGYVTDLFTDAALGFLDEMRDTPFLMFLSYTAPHTPMHARPEHLEKFKGHPRAKLAAMIWSADEGIGRVLDKLDELKLRDNTLVFFLSDNGGPFENGSDNGPLKGCKGSKFEGGQRTPFIMSWPAKIPAGSGFDGLVSAMDIYPTAAAATGVDATIGKPLDGVNLLPYVLNGKPGDPHSILFWQRSVEYAVRAGDYKVIGHEHHGWRLYNLEEDIGETKNLAKAKPEVAERMLAQFKAWKQNLDTPWWQENREWFKVKVEFYRAWLNNEEPNYTNPSQMKRYLKNHPESPGQ